ncbi:hypothetical protein F4775DRAFT_595838 [Biscogniauxia sp. FL1348]|nr:hypothetical protein F4775DRAFT_595838 [Biscogniauxia sp. FL1348]
MACSEGVPPSISGRILPFIDDPEDWKGMADPRKRRKLQNRLNQRASRQRRALQKAQQQQQGTGAAKSTASTSSSEDGEASQQPSSTAVVSRERPDNGDNRSMVLCHRPRTPLDQSISREIDGIEAYIPSLKDRGRRRMFQYSCETLCQIYPTGIPSEEPMLQSVYNAVLEDEILVYSLTWSFALQKWEITKDPGDMKFMLAGQLKTAQLIRQGLDKPRRTDSLLYAIMCISTAENEWLTKASPEDLRRGSFGPPIPALSLEHPGRVYWRDSYFNVFINLFNARGGLRTVTSSGLAEQFQMCDLLNASLKLKKPYLPLLPLSTLPGVKTASVKLGAPRDDYAGIGLGLQQIVQDLRLICRLIEEAMRSEPNRKNLIILRNSIQHRLLSLSPGRSDICRLACLVFSFAIVFPLPDTRSFRRCREALAKCMQDPDECGRYSKKLLLWAALLGAIASADTEHEKVFLGKIITLGRELAIHDWASIEDIVRKFVWLDQTCKSGGQVAWTRANLDGLFNLDRAGGSWI